MLVLVLVIVIDSNVLIGSLPTMENTFGLRTHIRSHADFNYEYCCAEFRQDCKSDTKQY